MRYPTQDQIYTSYEGLNKQRLIEYRAEHAQGLEEISESGHDDTIAGLEFRMFLTQVVHAIDRRLLELRAD